jgi:hypothetical protein
MKYNYTGNKTMSFTLNKDGKSSDFIIGIGQQNIELPEDNEHVQSLVQKNYLVPAQPEKQKSKPKS